MNEAIRVGVAGLGRSGWGIHCTTLRTVPAQYKVVAVTDPWRERAAESARDLQARHHETFEQMLADKEIEMVVVASPNPFHAPMAQAALRAGKHVLCEKPFGLTVADVDCMIAASRASGKVLQPFQQRRYEPDFRKVMEICRSGVLGEIHFVRICWHSFKRRWDWQTLRSMSGGALNNNGPHMIDHALSVFEACGKGNTEPEVWCDMRRGLCTGDAEDHLKIILRGAGRPTVEVDLSDLVAYSQDRWLICGSAGALRGDGSKLEWKRVDWSTMPARPIDPKPTPDRSYNSEKLTWKTDSWSPAVSADAGAGAAPAQQPVIDLYADLWKTIRQGAPQVITPQDVRRRVAVMEKARKASGIY